MSAEIPSLKKMFIADAVEQKGKGILLSQVYPTRWLLEFSIFCVVNIFHEAPLLEWFDNFVSRIG